MLTLVLEASTTSAKAMLYDSQKGVIAEASEAYSEEFSSEGMQDPEKVLDAIVRMGREVAEGQDVKSISVNGVWHSLIIASEDFTPVSPAYNWTYTKTAELCRAYRADKALAHKIYFRSGCMPHIVYMMYIMLQLKDEGYRFADKVFFTQPGYNFFRLTGERLETPSLMAGTGLLNVNTMDYDDEMLSMVGVTREQFGSLVGFRDTRSLTEEYADLLGISAGIPVVPAFPDGGLNQVGSSATEHGVMTFSVGTSAAIRLTTPKPILSDPPETWCYPGIEDWISGAATSGAGNCIEWFKKYVLKNKMSYEDLESAVLSETRTPVFLPFLYGERNPGWQDTRKAGFYDLTGMDDIDDMYHAILEGILFNIYHCYESLTALAGLPKKIILSGGILNSQKWTQMAADIFQTELHISENKQASILGGVALGLAAAGALDHPAEFESEIAYVLKPDPAKADLYRAKYQRYLYWYEKTKE